MGPVGGPLSQHKNQRHIGAGLHMEDNRHGGIRHVETGQRRCVFLQHHSIIFDGRGTCTRQEDLQEKQPSECALLQS